MKKRNFWHYLTGSFFQFFNSTSMMYSSLTTFAALSVVVVFFPFASLGLFTIALATGIGIASYKAVQQMREDERIAKLAQDNEAVEQRREDIKKKNLALILSLTLTEHEQLDSANQKLKLYEEFALLAKVLNDFLHVSTEDRQVFILNELHETLGKTWKTVAQMLDEAQQDSISLEKFNANLKQLLVYHLSSVSPKTGTVGLSPGVVPASLSSSGTNIPTLNNTQTTQIFSVDDMAARKRALWSGVKTTFGALALFVASATIIVTIIFPPAILPALVLPLLAVGVTVLATSLGIGTAAAYHNYRVIQPKRLEQQQIQQQYQQNQAARETLSRLEADERNSITKAAQPVANDTATAITVAKQTAKLAFKQLRQGISSIATTVRTTLEDKRLPIPTWTAFTQSSDATQVIASDDNVSVTRQLEAKPIAATQQTKTKLEAKPQALKDNMPSASSVLQAHMQTRRTIHLQRSWTHYLGAGLFQFIDKASSYYAALSVSAVVVAGIFTSLFAPYVMLAALGLTLVLSVATVTYLSVKEMQADKQLDTWVRESQAIEDRQKQLQHDIYAQRSRHIHALSLTHALQDQQINTLAELSLLVRALEDFLRTQTHDERLIALTELNETLGENWQSLQASFKNKTQDDTTIAKVIQVNTGIKTFLDSHVSADARMSYLSRHPRLQALISGSSSDTVKLPKTSAPAPVTQQVERPGAKRRFKTGPRRALTVRRIIFPPAVIPAIVVPLLGLGAVLLASSVAVGVSAAYYDYRVAQPKAQIVEQIKTQHQQYKALEPKLDSVQKRCKAEEKQLETIEVQDAAKQQDRLTAMKTAAKEAVKHLSQDFQTMTTEIKAHFQHKRILPDFDFLTMKPRRATVAVERLTDEEKPAPISDVAMAVGAVVSH